MQVVKIHGTKNAAEGFKDITALGVFKQGDSMSTYVL